MAFLPCPERMAARLDFASLLHCLHPDIFLALTSHNAGAFDAGLVRESGLDLIYISRAHERHLLLEEQRHSGAH